MENMLLLGEKTILAFSLQNSKRRYKFHFQQIHGLTRGTLLKVSGFPLLHVVFDYNKLI